MSAVTTYRSELEGHQHAPEQRFIGEIVTLVDNVGQGFGWWEGSPQQPASGSQPVVVNVPPPKDYTNVIVGVSAGLAAIVILMIVFLKK